MLQVSTVKGFLKEMDITVPEMQEKSRAGAGLLKFVNAVIGYCDVAKEVKPKREKVAKLERIFHQAKRDLERIQKEVNNLEEELNKLGKSRVFARNTRNMRLNGAL